METARADVEWLGVQIDGIHPRFVVKRRLDAYSYDNLKSVLPLRVFPLIRNVQECLVSMLANILCRHLVLPILESLFLVEGVQCGARLVLRAIGTGGEMTADATDLDCAFGFGQVALTLVISQFASFACVLNVSLTGAAICAAASDFHCRHEPYSFPIMIC